MHIYLYCLFFLMMCSNTFGFLLWPHFTHLFSSPWMQTPWLFLQEPLAAVLALLFAWETSVAGVQGHNLSLNPSFKTKRKLECALAIYSWDRVKEPWSANCDGKSPSSQCRRRKSKAYFILMPDKKDIFSRIQHLSFPGFLGSYKVSSQFDRRVRNSIV